jgi:hypothetical protein
MQTLQQMLDERLGHLNLSADDYNSAACDIANDHAQALLECGPDDFYYDEESDTSGPVHGNPGQICCFCGSNKEPNVDYDDEMEEYVFAGTYSDCECRSIVNDSLECTRTYDDDDSDLPF